MRCEIRDYSYGEPFFLAGFVIEQCNGCGAKGRRLSHVSGPQRLQTTRQEKGKGLPEPERQPALQKHQICKRFSHVWVMSARIAMLPTHVNLAARKRLFPADRKYQEVDFRARRRRSADFTVSGAPGGPSPLYSTVSGVPGWPKTAYFSVSGAPKG